jgi:carboxymethylenebutenolidase
MSTVETTRVTVEARDGAMPCFLAEPVGDGPFPGVLVLMEAFGLVASIESVARRIAAEGYVALAPDLYYRELPDDTASYDDLPRAMQLAGALLRHGDAYAQDVAAAIDFLEARPRVARGRIGMTGFCMGGALTFGSACLLPDRIAAAAPFYGGGIVRLLPLADRIRCPLLLFFAERDAHIPLEQVREIEKRLGELGKEFLLQVYPGAEHGFFCEDRAAVYHPQAARDAWQKLKQFFASQLAL